MCIIIDASFSSDLFRDRDHEDHKPVFTWLEKKNGAIVYGGRLSIELFNNLDVQRSIANYKRAGKAFEFDYSNLHDEEQVIVNDKNFVLRSNDPHILALARISGARTLLTLDQSLMYDFKSRSIISAPRGGIYKNKDHKHLLNHPRSCMFG